MRPALLLALLTSCATTPTSNVPTKPVSEQHAWLQQMVGEWDLEFRAEMGPPGKPVSWTGAESVEALGGTWVLAETTATSPQGSFRALLTLGYDTTRETYVGSWVDSMQRNMWTYDAVLDPESTTLTLSPTIAARPEAPEPDRYRDQIQLIGPDERVLTSSYRGDDGAWTPYLRVRATRRP